MSNEAISKKQLKRHTDWNRMEYKFLRQHGHSHQYIEYLWNLQASMRAKQNDQMDVQVFASLTATHEDIPEVVMAAC